MIAIDLFSLSIALFFLLHFYIHILTMSANKCMNNLSKIETNTIHDMKYTSATATKWHELQERYRKSKKKNELNENPKHKKPH